jgi:WD40 repeat protein
MSVEGAMIVSASNDKTLKVWDGRSGAELFTLSGHADWVNDCAVSADGAIIVSASGDGTLKVWDGRNGVERLTLSGHADWVNGCVVSAEGSMIVSASHDQTLKVWDALTGACMTTLHVDGALEVCACSRDSEVIAAAGVRGIYFLRLLR